MELKLDGDGALWEGCKVKTIVDANMTRTAIVLREVKKEKIDDKKEESKKEVKKTIKKVTKKKTEKAAKNTKK